MAESYLYNYGKTAIPPKGTAVSAWTGPAPIHIAPTTHRVQLHNGGSWVTSPAYRTFTFDRTTVTIPKCYKGAAEKGYSHWTKKIVKISRTASGHSQVKEVVFVKIFDRPYAVAINLAKLHGSSTCP